jgi:hypothetical protein
VLGAFRSRVEHSDTPVSAFGRRSLGARLETTVMTRTAIEETSKKRTDSCSTLVDLSSQLNEATANWQESELNIDTSKTHSATDPCPIFDSNPVSGLEIVILSRSARMKNHDCRLTS